MMNTKQTVSIVFLGIALIFGANAMDPDRGGKKESVSPDLNPAAEGSTVKGRKKGGYGPANDARMARHAMDLANKELAQRGFLAPANPSNGNSTLLQTNETAARALQEPPAPAKGTNLHVLHFNLCWECMARSPDGSGKVASIFCDPGKEKNIEVSTCSENVLKNVGTWQRQTPFDILTFAELGSPQANTDASISWNKPDGFDVSNPKGAKQTHIDFYTELAAVFQDYKFILNKQPVVRPFDLQSLAYDHSLTAYKPATFKEYGEPTVLRTSLTPGRLLTALIFEGEGKKKVMVVNMHSIHFRKNLITPTTLKDRNGGPIKIVNNDLIGHEQVGGPPDPTGLMEYASANYVAMGGVNCDKAQAAQGGDCFSIKKCSTACLAKIYGGFIEERITKAAEKAAEERITKAAGQAEAAEDTKAAEIKKAAKGITQDIKRVIMSGDFNDETGELISFNVFENNVGIRADQRKRTCCSDRDARWLEAAQEKKKLDEQKYFKWRLPAFPGYDRFKLPAFKHSQPMTDFYTDHAEANWEYLVKQSKYGTREQILETRNAVLTGQDKAAPTGKKYFKAFSRYPFASDLILDSEGVTKLGFPKGYVQKLGEGTMSDHDPIVATLPEL